MSDSKWRSSLQLTNLSKNASRLTWLNGLEPKLTTTTSASRSVVCSSSGLQHELEWRHPGKEFIAELQRHRFARQPSQYRSGHDAANSVVLLAESSHPSQPEGLHVSVGTSARAKSWIVSQKITHNV